MEKQFKQTLEAALRRLERAASYAEKNDKAALKLKIEKIMEDVKEVKRIGL